MQARIGSTNQANTYCRSIQHVKRKLLTYQNNILILLSHTHAWRVSKNSWLQCVEMRRTIKGWYKRGGCRPVILTEQNRYGHHFIAICKYIDYSDCFLQITKVVLTSRPLLRPACNVHGSELIIHNRKQLFLIQPYKIKSNISTESVSFKLSLSNFNLY